MRVVASSFEIVRNIDQSTSGGKPPLMFGYVGVDDDNTKAFEALKELCSRDSVDKIIIVYHDYAFSLIGVSLTKSNVNPPSIRLGTAYKFCAKDIQLERLSEF